MSKRDHHRRTTARHVWLAALGLGVVARRGASDATHRLAARARTLNAGLVRLGEDGADVALGALLTAQERIAPLLARKAPQPRRRSGSSGSVRSARGGRRRAATRLARKGRG